MKMPDIESCAGEIAVTSWEKSVGETVAVGELLLRVECDKASVDIYSDVGGTLAEIFFREGELVKPGDIIARIE